MFNFTDEDKQNNKGCPFIKHMKKVGILTDKKPLDNDERIALWHEKGGPNKWRNENYTVTSSVCN